MVESGAVTIDEVGRFTAWVQPSVVAMTRLALRLAPHTDAADLVQDAFERAWRKRAHYDPERGTPTVWLLAITADLARNARRTHVRRSRVVAPGAVVPDSTSAKADPVVDVDLETAIGRLGERQRLTVHCYYFVGLTVDETAQVMHCSPGTVKSTLHDARARLRTIRGDTDED